MCVSLSRAREARAFECLADDHLIGGRRIKCAQFRRQHIDSLAASVSNRGERLPRFDASPSAHHTLEQWDAARRRCFTFRRDDIPHHPFTIEDPPYLLGAGPRLFAGAELHNPHTLAIARLYCNDYARAGVRVLPVVDADGQSTERQIVMGCLSLLAVSLLPTLVGMA